MAYRYYGSKAMDSSDDFLSVICGKSREHRFTGAWELVGTAAGVPEAVLKTQLGLDPFELSKGAMSEKAVGPSVVAQRVEALSVCDRRLVDDLFGRLGEMPREVIEDNECIRYAYESARAFLFPASLDEGAPEWSWER